MTTRLDQTRTQDPVPLCLMLSDDEDMNIRMMFERPARLDAPRRRRSPGRVPMATVGTVLAGVFAAVLLAVRKGLA